MKRTPLFTAQKPTYRQANWLGRGCGQRRPIREATEDILNGILKACIAENLWKTF